MLRSAYVFFPLLLLVITEGYFPVKQPRFLLHKLFNFGIGHVQVPVPVGELKRYTKILLSSLTAYTTTTVHPTCFQLLSSSLPVCHRKKRQYFWDDIPQARNSPFMAEPAELHAMPQPYAVQYFRPVELFTNQPAYNQYGALGYRDYEESEPIQPSIKAPAPAEGRFLLQRTIVSTHITTTTQTHTAGRTVTNILPCIPLSGVSGCLCNPSVYPAASSTGSAA
ncbi:uncharacterized protein LOC136031853 isoform X2 [Artemia franciscana]|uniref:uncharacterized protein LOC136031853 isoform X2 n=1 Tax=Artemia franciscana TaxID=6661 RepID=UPI0032DA7D57